jgi:hypothetical protein
MKQNNFPPILTCVVGLGGILILWTTGLHWMYKLCLSLIGICVTSIVAAKVEGDDNMNEQRIWKEAILSRQEEEQEQDNDEEGEEEEEKCCVCDKKFDEDEDEANCDECGLRVCSEHITPFEEANVQLCDDCRLKGKENTPEINIEAIVEARVQERLNQIKPISTKTEIDEKEFDKIL